MISFDNTEYAFAYKTNSELKKSRLLYNAMGKSYLLSMAERYLPFAVKYHLPFTNSIVRLTLFELFVGGETLEKTKGVVDKLSKFNVQVILDYGVEGGNDGEKGYEEATNEFVKVIEYAATQPGIPFMSVKVTGLVRFGLLEKIDSLMNAAEGTLINRYTSVLNTLPENEKAEWQRCLDRLERICTTAEQKNIGVMIDAEETWIQDPVDAATMIMMDRHNKDRAVIFNTVQLYRSDRYKFLQDCHEAAAQRGFILAVKIVRGAYMEKERKRAAENGYPSPIQPTKAATDNDYNKAVEYCLQHLAAISVIIASHNEDSNLLATKLMNMHGISANNDRVHFSQLYGMSDNITFNLAKEGYNVSKYLPFGPIEDVVPYLMRRAQENSSVAGQTGRELSLIHKEIKRRNI